MTAHRRLRVAQSGFAIWLFAICPFIFGCGPVERRISITSEPSGAHVHLNDTDVGYTPLEVDFTWFGSYEVRVSKPGYEAIREARDVNAPLHEQPGIDLLALMVPGRKATRIDWHFDLTPAAAGDDDELILRARELQMSLDDPE